ncbi:hypothetical protein EGW08_016668 [Elysia chlorotica]|uniref:Uncharacterized protein n=1 Tax=Elysia chlorotica TaxID=188477 RepID=A0A3S1B9X6_ELYCH|nr:hypothetical protein EGW08_016668 [Elysia chlorotica]
MRSVPVLSERSPGQHVLHHLQRLLHGAARVVLLVMGRARGRLHRVLDPRLKVRVERRARARAGDDLLLLYSRARLAAVNRARPGARLAAFLGGQESLFDHSPVIEELRGLLHVCGLVHGELLVVSVLAVRGIHALEKRGLCAGDHLVKVIVLDLPAAPGAFVERFLVGVGSRHHPI